MTFCFTIRSASTTSAALPRSFSHEDVDEMSWEDRVLELELEEVMEVFVGELDIDEDTLGERRWLHEQQQ